jgi:adenylate cyclase
MFIARAIVVIVAPFVATYLEHFVHQPRVLNASFDLALRMAPYAIGQPRVQIVDIDDSSLARVGGRPWSHRIMAELLDRLHEAGAAVVGFDLKFAGPSADNGTSEAAPHADQLFADAIGRMPVVIGFTMTDTSGNGLR